MVSSSSSSSNSNDYQQQTSSSRPVSHKRNAGRKKFKETRHPIYRGVRKRDGCKWVCEVRIPNKKSTVWLGTHQTPEIAARAYDVAALALRGKSAPLNFPHSAHLLPQPKSNSAVDIRAAAYAAAQAFAPLPSCEEIAKEKISEPSSSYMFWDEEAVFDMPRLLDSMAQGMLLAPPTPARFDDWDYEDYSVDMSLWTHNPS